LLLILWKIKKDFIAVVEQTFKCTLNILFSFNDRQTVISTFVMKKKEKNLRIFIILGSLTIFW
jgi:hypothetical protein